MEDFDVVGWGRWKEGAVRGEGGGNGYCNVTTKHHLQLTNSNQSTRRWWCWFYSRYCRSTVCRRSNLLLINPQSQIIRSTVFGKKDLSALFNLHQTDIKLLLQKSNIYMNSSYVHQDSRLLVLEKRIYLEYAALATFQVRL